MLDKQFFSNPEFHPFINKHFIAFHAVRGEKEGDRVYSEYAIRATPTVLIADVDGSEIDRHVGYLAPPEKFKIKIEKSLTGNDTFVKLRKRYEKDPSNLITTFKLARKYDRMYDTEKTANLLKEVLAKAEEAKKHNMLNPGTEKDVNVYEWARYMASRDLNALLKFYEDFPGSQFTEMVVSRIASSYAYSNPAEEGLDFFNMAMEKYPTNKNLKNYFVSYCTNSKSNFEKGIEVGEKLIDSAIIPYPYYISNFAQLLKANNDDEKLRDLYAQETIESRNGLYATGLYNYANYWNEQEENLQSAEEMVILALKLVPDRTYYRQLAAEICFKNEKPEEANRIFGPEFITSKMDKKNDIFYYVRFWAKQGKNLESALEMAEHYNKRFGDYTGPQLLAEAHLGLGNDSKAIDIYGENFVKEYETEANILNSYAWFWSEKGKNLATALNAIKKSVKLNPSPYTWDTMSLVYLKMERYQDAIDAEQKALELSPNNFRFIDRIDEIKNKMKKVKRKIGG